MDADQQELVALLREARWLLARPGNNFDGSSWPDVEAALREVDGLIASIEADRLPPRLAIAALFAATGPIQEVSLRGGWAAAFLALAGRWDAVRDQVYGRRS